MKTARIVCILLLGLGVAAGWLRPEAAAAGDRPQAVCVLSDHLPSVPCDAYSEARVSLPTAKSITGEDHSPYSKSVRTLAWRGTDGCLRPFYGCNGCPDAALAAFCRLSLLGRFNI